jgi:hypothetical protein
MDRNKLDWDTAPQQSLKTMACIPDLKPGQMSESGYFQRPVWRRGHGTERQVDRPGDVAVREAIGLRTGLMLDANHGYDAVDRVVAQYSIMAD